MPEATQTVLSLPYDYLVDVLRIDLARLGWRRVIVLGPAQHMGESRLVGGLAAWGFQVLVPPEAERAWVAEALAAGGEGLQTDAERLAALLQDGLEHGVEGIVVTDPAMFAAVRACAPQAPALAASLRGDACPVRNLVLDMGGVLFRWEPLRMARRVCDNDQDAELLVKAVFGSQEWAWQDAGAVSEQTVLWASKTRVPERLHRQVDQLVLHWHDHRANIEGMDALICDAKAAGYGVYLLSNAGESFERYQAQLPGRDCFDGMVVSYREHVVKPDARIYEVLLARYGLRADECLFADDTPRNVLGARRVGMRAWHFDGDASALRGVLLG